MNTPPLQAESGGKPRVFIVDDHQLFLDGLAHALKTSGEFCVVGTANNVQTAKQLLPGLGPDILMVDLMMPGESGLELIEYAVKNHLAKHVLTCSGTSNRHSVAAAIACGARCFLEKTSSFEVLLSTLRAVAQGRAPMGEFECSTLREIVAGELSHTRFSAKELEILRYLANNECPKAIGAKVGLSVSAIYKTKHRLLEQAKVKNVFLLAIQLGIVPADGAGNANHLAAS